MSNARDELAKLLFVVDNRDALDAETEWRTAKPEYQDYAYILADAILAAGYTKPRTVTTVEELDALAVGSVVLDGAEYVARKERGGDAPNWAVTLHKFSNDASALSLPATVLYEPTI